MQAGIAGDAAHVAEGGADRLAERDADILHRVVEIDVQVAGGLDVHVDARMASQQVQHVVEETDPGRDLRLARAVEIDGKADLRFLGGAGDAGRTHGQSCSRKSRRLSSIAAHMPYRGAPARPPGRRSDLMRLHRFHAYVRLDDIPTRR